jgi:hypothetical protein
MSSAKGAVKSKCCSASVVWDSKVGLGHLPCVGVVGHLHCKSLQVIHFSNSSMAVAWQQGRLCINHATADFRQIFWTTGGR